MLNALAITILVYCGIILFEKIAAHEAYKFSMWINYTVATGFVGAYAWALHHLNVF